MRGIIESANFKEEWDKTSWKIENEFYSIKGDFSHMAGKEVIFEVYTVPKSGGKHVSGGAFTVANEHPDYDTEPGAPTQQAKGNGEVTTRQSGPTDKDRQIVFCVALKSILDPWISPEDDSDRVEYKALEARRIAKIVSSPVKAVQTQSDEPGW